MHRQWLQPSGHGGPCCSLDPRSAHASPDPGPGRLPQSPGAPHQLRAGRALLQQRLCFTDKIYKGFLSPLRSSIPQPAGHYLLVSCLQGPLREQTGAGLPLGRSIIRGCSCLARSRPPLRDVPPQISPPPTPEGVRSQPGAGPALPRPVMGSRPPRSLSAQQGRFPQNTSSQIPPSHGGKTTNDKHHY